MPFLERKKYAAVLVFPVRNEALILERSIRLAHTVALKFLPSPWLIIIAVNDSTDETLPIAKRLADQLPNVVARVLSEPGKGRAVLQSWMSVQADYYFFSDIDLSVDLTKALPLMMQAFVQGADIATCSRALAHSTVTRPLYRRLISLGYRWLARVMTDTRLSDLPCGCKGVNKDVVLQLVPQVLNKDWFFDTELLLLAEAASYKISEVPVSWIEYKYSGRNSGIPLLKIIKQYISALIAMRRRLKLRK
ncbi:hypothetical protein A3H10_04405 [Candidatus Uhrbacteria bacterium RIFCSPLOWO2_12_FULL_46_10]|uniref:Glycosyltransferase 2-like domain-containing protein n=1 Tax=Candidatus Uhrbacteria bacterium RIFCSPLOWO2_01_FULL_47_25 TaxID=1802402 RepID=A0A1F7UZ91_9BACT|nr:MAG: Glycosyl transferase [Parcubacteria group bacterium GW2011_GWA2_46_9]OGL59765.1 MAG: hypothetical protein A2752_03190 [Candidatus Uhrbacteria bacterium RIFCSPHIGHO2_01_FULL_46_23]OGL70561.1 MAG: hypothetical protein A3D60_03760 [Candidatus Uhrbacteria bacterium RIFCSPHIGHO2_02_FULL_47_29]OGL75817.1 MAG: hypothetical protein A3E96_02700 [Candidatus Uhrbacteria bacterium RIFCSPHIGHO2_12_FULL_46_13]OGL83094.1 MAG: hypothetical protein A2936_05265 [Candidatus Uhrbacteria bacterium RIFCSPLOW